MGTKIGTLDNLITFQAGQVTAAVAELNTTSLPPGNYRLIGRVIDDFSLTRQNKILDELATTITIVASTRVPEVTVELLPVSSAVGVTETINVVGKFTNLSNVSTNVALKFRILDSSGSDIKDPGNAGFSFANVTLQPQSDAVQQLLTSFTHTFATSGQFAIEVFYTGGTQPEQINTIGMQVQPGLRVDSKTTITPDTVKPDPNQRIRINVRLDGKEVQ